ncbi:MAG: PAS domain-containing protein [Rhodospirillaceae bacterium]|nr:PAS domain-containing protein [Rhodospirillaceae bacterium]
MTVDQQTPTPELPNRATDAFPVLNALADAILVIRRGGAIAFANMAAEQFFDASLAQMKRRGLDHYVPADSPILGLVEQAFATDKAVREFGLTIETPRIGRHFVTVQAAPIVEEPDTLVLSIQAQGIARKIDRQLTHRGAARSVTAMAAMLAHEVKNPLSGIRGAAQLLEGSLSAEDRSLTKLICDETDRIVELIDRMEVFADRPPKPREPVNIHQVLDHVKAIALAGFARGMRIREEYDPSLPPVLGDRDRLIQVFLNLVKNAAEAAPRESGEIVLATAYKPGVRLAVPGSDRRVQLPLVVSVQDNGEGIPEDIRAHLFDPFVTTKAKGTGLGLALVAKIVDDHGGVIEFASERGRTVFTVMLPVYRPEGESK